MNYDKITSNCVAYFEGKLLREQEELNKLEDSLPKCSLCGSASLVWPFLDFIVAKCKTPGCKAGEEFYVVSEWKRRNEVKNGN